MTDLSKLFTLLDDPEIRVLLYGLAHAGPAIPGPAIAGSRTGPARLRVLVAYLIETVPVEQHRSWLSDTERNTAMGIEQVRAVIGYDAIADVARYTDSSPEAVAFQLAAVLPDLADALSPGGVLVGAAELARELDEAAGESDRSGGVFGPHVH
ncbi:hypothetical protein GCM10010172_04240 [Paractinoplanes ferrugineus]|uniref:Uncharacterized protein n=1 Tax=Paractinoplanes ferrugineus TaxID=113564 RepID=A0A919J566_9ACTN|nr:YidB family protein [Actinoplanes ferrugineus]GIE13829.1 hypothetical protein Afe05nite_56690 [Actinoplanes ferrugineus]